MKHLLKNLSFVQQDRPRIGPDKLVTIDKMWVPLLNTWCHSSLLLEERPVISYGGEADSYVVSPTECECYTCSHNFEESLTYK